MFNPSASSGVGGVNGFVDLGDNREALSVPPRRLPLAAVFGCERSLSAWVLSVVSGGGGC